MSAVATEANRGQQITWSWSPRLLCIGYSGVPAAQNSGPLQQQCLLLTAPLQPMFYFGFHFLMVFFFLYFVPVSQHCGFLGLNSGYPAMQETL